jgi:hypothetical protein
VRNDDEEGRHEVHGRTYTGAGAELRTDLRAFHGVQTLDLHFSVATYEAMANTKRVTPTLIQRMCGHGLSAL